MLVRLAVKLGDGHAARRVADAVEAGAELAPEVASVQSAAQRCRGLAAQDADQLVEAVHFARRGCGASSPPRTSLRTIVETAEQLLRTP